MRGERAKHSRHGVYRDAFADWLTQVGAKATSLPELIDGFCRFLNAHGYRIRRCNLATDTVHPQMTGMRHVWFDRAADPGPINPAVVVARRQYNLGPALIDEVFFNAGSQQNPQYLASPFYKVEQQGELYDTVRRAGSEQPFPVFRDLAEIGCTAYFGLKLDSFAGMLQKIGLATARRGGLSEAQRDDLRWSLLLLTLHINTLVEFSIKNTLARAYIGRDPGRRVCEGMIALGRLVTLDAAIWFSDLRGFTVISEKLSPEQLIESLNSYFAAVVEPIYEHGGEVLKYIGDAILAIFPVADLGSPAAACRAALASAQAADANLLQVNAERCEKSMLRLEHGVGLHFGPVRYGNIGSSERLDFTVIGREVNVASRIESMTKALGEPLLCSDDFRDAAGVDLRRVGEFPLKGVSATMPLHAPGHRPPDATREQ